MKEYKAPRGTSLVGISSLVTSLSLGFGALHWRELAALRVFRAFLTDPNRTVVLRYSDRVVVISPELPEQFVRTLSETRSIN